jgi:hypothetical protein
MTGAIARAVIALAAFVLLATPATAQFTVFRQAAPARPSRGIEFGIGGLFGGPVTFGTASAELQRPDGGALPLFTTSNRQSPELGLSTYIAGPVRSRAFAEVAATISRATFETTIGDDFEGAAPVTLEERFLRFVVEGGGGYNLRRSDRSAVFIRATGGWMRELVAGSAVAQDGVVANVGVGVKYWGARHQAGRLRYGLRVEGHLAARWNGMALNTKTIHVAPVVTGAFIIGS